MDKATSVVPEAGHQMEGYKTKLLLKRITDIQWVIDDMLGFYEKYDKDYKGLGPVANQVWITDGLKRMRKKAADIGILIDPSDEYRRHFHKEMDKGGCLIGELYPAFIGSDWCRVPAMNWRYYTRLAFEIGGDRMLVETRNLEEHAWGVPNATAGGDIKYADGDKCFIIDVKPVVHEWNDGEQFINSHWVDAKLTGDGACRPVFLKVRGVNPKQLMKNPFSDLDRRMFADPESKLDKQISESEDRMVAHVQEKSKEDNQS